jgi:hypothetical protein
MVVYSIYVCFFQYPTSLFLFLILYPVPPPSCRRLHLRRPVPHHHLSHATLSYTIFHTQLYPTPSHTIFHIQLCHTHNFVTHSLSRTTLSNTIFQTSQTIFHTQLCHTRSFTHHLSHTIFFKHHLLHTIFHTHLSHTTLSHALAHSNLRFAWQAWHLWHWAGSGCSGRAGSRLDV